MLAGALAFTAGTAGLAGAGLAQSAHGMHSMHGGMATMDPAAMDAHFEAMFAQMVPDATPDQKARLKAMAKAIHADLGAVHAQFGQSHQRLHALLLRPAIDRAGLEALRAEQVHQIDIVSRRLVDKLADAAEVLTPAQRVRLTAKLGSPTE